MNVDKASPSPLAKFRGKPFLIRDQNGSTRFYDNGPRSYGYLVPESRNEWEFREAIRRFEVVDAIFGYVMVIPATISIFALGSEHSDRAFAALSVSIAIVVIGRALERNWYFGELVSGLTRVEPLDMAQRRKGNLFLMLVGIAYFSFVFWRILRAFGVS